MQGPCPGLDAAPTAERGSRLSLGPYRRTLRSAPADNCRPGRISIPVTFSRPPHRHPHPPAHHPPHKATPRPAPTYRDPFHPAVAHPAHPHPHPIPGGHNTPHHRTTRRRRGSRSSWRPRCLRMPGRVIANRAPWQIYWPWNGWTIRAAAPATIPRRSAPPREHAADAGPRTAVSPVAITAAPQCLACLPGSLVNSSTRQTRG